jgi:hypothetical protein
VLCVSGFTVRLYGSSISGFGLKLSDVNLDLLVPQEKSAAQGLAAASDLIASQDAYRYTLNITLFTHSIAFY